MRLVPIILFLACILFLNSAVYAQVSWNFTGNVVTPTNSIPNINSGNITTANPNGAAPVFAAAGLPSSNTYTGASGGGNGNMCAKTGIIAPGSSTYAQVILTPTTGFSVIVSGIKWGNYSSLTTGPTILAVYSSLDNFTSAIVTSSATINAWSLITPTIPILMGNVNTPVTLRIYGGGATTATPGVVNWRIDDVQINGIQVATTNFPSTPNIVTKFVDNLGKIGNSIMFDNGTNVGFGTILPAAKIDVIGQVKITDGSQGAGKVFTSDANGLGSWAVNGNGSVTSVGLSMPGGFNVSSSPVTTSGILTVSNNLSAGFVKSSGTNSAFTSVSNINLNSLDVTGILPVSNGGTGTALANANTVFAGPFSGVPASPVFRLLNSADLPVHYHALNSSTDVSLSTLSTGNLLKWNGSIWVNFAPDFINNANELDPTVGAHIKAITVQDIANWNSGAAPLTFNNGLTRILNNISLGGSLVQNTSINVPTNNFLQIATNNTNTSGGSPANSRIHMGANYINHYGTTNPQNWSQLNVYENYGVNGENPAFLSMSTPNINSANGWMFYNFGDQNSVYQRMVTRSNYLRSGLDSKGFEHVVNVLDPNVNFNNYAYMLYMSKNTNPSSFYDGSQPLQYMNLFGIRNAGTVMLTLKANGQLILPAYLNDINESQVLTTDVNGMIKLKSFSLAGGSGFTGTANGLSSIGSNVQLGGMLDHHTIEDMATYNFTFKNGSSTVLSALSTGSVGIGADATGKTLLIRKDALNALGSTLEILNGGGVNPPIGNTYTGDLLGSVSIDLNPYFNNTVSNIISQIKAVGAGDFSSHIIFSTKGVSQADDPLLERMRITSTGNVAIGTTDPKNYKLAVAGPMIAEKVVVKLQANWPDFVFDENYKLMPLIDLGIFINKHKHLPGLLSAEELRAKDGIDIASIQSKLLEKVEELTLYILEKEKQLAEQHQQIEILKKRMEKMEMHN